MLKKKLKKGLDIKMKIFVFQSGKLLQTSKKEYREFLFIPKKYEFESNIFIYSGKVAILNVQSEPYYGLIIDNYEFYMTQKNLFELLWAVAKK